MIAGVAIGRFVAYEAPRSATPPVGAGQPASIESLEQRVAANPDDAGGWQALGVAYLQRAAEVGDPSFYGLAEQALDQAATLAPSDPTVTLGQGALALALHQFPEALELGTRVTASLPSSPDALAVLVDAQVEMGRYEEAEASLQRMLDLRPGLPALARASYLRELHGDLPGAIEAMTRAEGAGSGPYDLAATAALLGNLHLRVGDLAAAEGAYERALRASPGLVLAEVGRARLLAASDRPDEAIEALQGVVKRFPAPEAVILLGDLSALQGDSAAAEEAYALVGAIAALQRDAGQVVDLEMALFEADRGDDRARALELARQAYEVRPDSVFTADALAWALLQAGDPAGALPYLDQALRLGTADPLVRYHAAEIHLALGNPDAARAELAQALSGTPWFSVRYHDRAQQLADELGVPTAA